MAELAVVLIVSILLGVFVGGYVYDMKKGKK